MSIDAESPATVLFRARLSPHRSLSRRAFRRVMLVVTAISLTASTGFYLAGAWPVFGFMGLDIALVYLALRTSYRSARMSETLELTETELVVLSADQNGKTRRFSFAPAWLRVELNEPVMPDTPLILRSHGRALRIARFVGPAERRALAQALTDALIEWRAVRYLPI
jgi:uncharacterized membrane protein